MAVVMIKEEAAGWGGEGEVPLDQFRIVDTNSSSPIPTSHDLIWKLLQTPLH